MNVTFETTGGNKGGTNEWYTPPSIIKDLGEFDLDPCFKFPRPWDTAKTHYGDRGLEQPWFGFVWCNPPYGDETALWLEKCAEYKACIALIFARTETKMFHKYIWEHAKAVYFFKGRIAFHKEDGSKGQSAGAPSCLVAWDDEGVKRLLRYEAKNGGKTLFCD